MIFGDSKIIDQISKECTDENPANNMLISENISLGFNSQHSKHNNNVLVLGSYGFGEDYRYAIPNILNTSHSFVVTDPKGEIYKETHQILEEKNYNIQVLNVVDFDKSMHYNPLSIIQQQYESKSASCEISIAKLIEIFETEYNKEYCSCPFWGTSQKTILRFVIKYLLYTNTGSKEITFTDIIDVFNKIADLLNSDKCEYEDVKQKLGLSEEEFCRDLQTFFMGGIKTKKAVLVNCIIMLQPFTIHSFAQISKKDDIKENNIDFDKLCQDKSALFVITSTTDFTFNFWIKSLIMQLMDYCIQKRTNILKDSPKAQFSHIQFFIDDFYTRIIDLGAKMSVIRKYNIGITLCFQCLSQIRGIYKEESGIIISNCDTVIYMGGKDEETMNFITNKSEVKPGILIKKPQTIKFNELYYLSNENCAVVIRGFAPIIDKKIKRNYNA